MGRDRLRRSKRRRGRGSILGLTDGQCVTCRAGIENPFFGGYGDCECPCDSLHPDVAACPVTAPARRILEITIPDVGFSERVQVCVPCGQALGMQIGGDHDHVR